MLFTHYIDIVDRTIKMGKPANVSLSYCKETVQ